MQGPLHIYCIANLWAWLAEGNEAHCTMHIGRFKQSEPLLLKMKWA
jgi:hypothetical protein